MDSGYFTEFIVLAAIVGGITAFMIVNIDEASQIPGVAEPMFLGLNARLEIIPVMTPEDLAKAMA